MAALALRGRIATLVALVSGVIGRLASPVAAQTVTWNNSGNANLDTGSNWIGGNVPNSSQVALFSNATFSPSALAPQSSSVSFGGIVLAAGAGPLSFTGPGSGGAKTISIGASGVTNNSTSSFTFDISSKVNIVLTASTAFTANGQIVVTDAPTNAIRFDLGINTLTLNGTNTASSIAQELGGTGGIVKSGSGTWTLSGNNVYTGTTTVAQGTLNVSNIVVGTGASAYSNLGNATSSVGLGDATNKGTLSYTGNTATFTRGFTVNAGGGEFDVTTSGQTVTIATGNVATNGIGVFTVGGAGNTTISSVVAGTGGLAKVGAGTLTLGGNNTFTGPVNVSAGTLTVNSGATLASNSGTFAPLVVNGGTLNLNNAAQTIASLTGSGGTINFGGTLTDNQAILSAFSGTLAGSGSFVKSGAGALHLNGISTYSGTTTVNAGTLQFGQQTALYNNSTANWTATNLVVNSGATAAFNVGGAGEFTAANLDTLKALGTASGGFKSGSFIGFDTTHATGEFIYNGNIANPNGGANVLGVVKLGPGTLTLGGNNTYSGDTNVIAGTLKLGSATAFSPNTNVHIATGAVFDTNGFTPVVSGNSTINAPISGTGGLTTGPGTQTLGAANTYSGPTNISSGSTVILGAPGALPTGTPVTLSTGATLDLNGNTATLGKLEGTGGAIALTSGASLTVDQPGNSIFSGTISGTGGFVKTGVGQLILNGNQTFTGPTTISDGDLKINGSAAGSAFTVSGGILSGSGTVGTLTVASGGTLAPGSSPGLLTVNGNLTLSGTTSMELSGTTRGVGGYDAVDVTGGGAITFGGTLSLSLIGGYNPTGGESFNLFDWTGATTGTFGTVNLPSLSGGLTWDSSALYTAGVLSVTGSAIPEPSAYAALAASLLFAFALWRRRFGQTTFAGR